MQRFHVRTDAQTVAINDTIGSLTNFLLFLAFHSLPSYTPPAPPFREEFYSQQGDGVSTTAPVWYYSDGVTRTNVLPPSNAARDLYITLEAAWGNYLNNFFALPPTQPEAATVALNISFNNILMNEIAPYSKIFDATTGDSFVNLNELAARNTLQTNYNTLAAQIPSLAPGIQVDDFIDDIDQNLRTGITFPISHVSGAPVYIRQNEKGVPNGGVATLGANGRLNTAQQYNEHVSAVLCNGAGGVQPSFALAANYVEQFFNYGVGALNFSSPPTQTVPGNYPGPLQEKDFFDRINGTFIENYKSGLLHTWRIRFSYTGKNVNAIVFVRLRLFNPAIGSTFSLELSYPLGNGTGTGSGQGTLVFNTIADNASLPPAGYSTNIVGTNFGTGQGYRLALSANDAINVTITQVARLTGTPQF